MNEKQIFKSTWIKWGVILGVAGLTFNVVLGFLGLFGNQKMGWLSLIISVGAIVAAFIAYKQENKGYMKFGRSIGLAAMIGLIGGVISSFLVVGYMFLDPGMMEQLIEHQVEQSMKVFEERGMDMAEEDLRAQMESDTVKTFTYLGLLVAGPIMSVIGCVLIGLVTGAVMKNDPPAGYDSSIDEMGNDS